MLLPHAIAVTVPPTATPVSLAEIKAHLVVQHDLDDSLLNVLLKAATGHVQTAANLYLMPQTVEIGFASPDLHPPHIRVGVYGAGGFGAGTCGAGSGSVELPVWPIRAVSAVQYLDANGDTQTWSSGDYQTWLTHRPPLIAPAYGQPWPTTRAGALKPLWVTATVGYANAAAVPEEAKHPIRLIVAHAYANKGDGKDPTGEMGIPPAAKAFIEYLRQDFYR